MCRSSGWNSPAIRLFPFLLFEHNKSLDSSKHLREENGLRPDDLSTRALTEMIISFQSDLFSFGRLHNYEQSLDSASFSGHLSVQIELHVFSIKNEIIKRSAYLHLFAITSMVQWQSAYQKLAVSKALKNKVLNWTAPKDGIFGFFLHFIPFGLGPGLGASPRLGLSYKVL